MSTENKEKEYGEKIENAKYILDNIKEWINNVDIKISILIAFMGVVLGYILIDSNIDFIERIVTTINNNSLSFSKIAKGLLVLLLYFNTIFSIIKLIYALKGKINIKEFKESGVTLNSLVFYGSISKYNYEEFNKKIKNQTKQSNINDILSQVYINSKICNKKFKNYNIGLNMAMITIILLFIVKIFKIIYGILQF